MSTPADAGYREKLSIDQVVLRQLDRRNHLASYDHESAVRQGMNNLPSSSRAKVEGQSDTFVTRKFYMVYDSYCGVKLGSLDDPYLHDETKPVERKDDGMIDWPTKTINEDGSIMWTGDMNIKSPRIEELEETDYHLMDAAIMEALESASLTFNQESVGTVRKNQQLRGAMPALDNKPRPYLRGKLPDEEKESKS